MISSREKFNLKNVSCLIQLYNMFALEPFSCETNYMVFKFSFNFLFLENKMGENVLKIFILKIIFPHLLIGKNSDS